jgi:ABC-type amino acid transport substrate-binding protein
MEWGRRGARTCGVTRLARLSYTLGDGKYVGYHVEICQRIIASAEKAVGKKLEIKYQPVTSQNRIPAGAKRHRGH